MWIGIALLLAASAMFGQDLCTDITAIDKFAKNLSSASLTKPWRRFELSSVDEKARWHEVTQWAEPNADVALVYAGKAEAPLKVLLILTSLSGDWTHEVEFYFRADGTLAKRYDYLGTFYGEVKAHRNTWFDCSGKQLKSERRFYQLGTDKRLKSPGPDFTDEPVPLYKTVKGLPFYPLLPR